MAIIDKPSDYFNTVLYTGNGGTQSITGLDFQPDWVWLKCRNRVEEHVVFDVIRGATKKLLPNSSNAESTEANTLTSFNSDGFSLGSAGLSNSSGDTFASWNWKAGTSFTNDASATGIGSIDSTGSASDTSGFSIVSYTGTGSAGSIKHGLTSAPGMMIIKNRSDAQNWVVYHQSIGNTKNLYLNRTDATNTTSGWFNNTSPTSTVFTIGNDGAVSGNGDNLVAYCFAEKNGFSKFGSYVGNGSTSSGTFVYTGFKVGWVMTKSIAVEAWQMTDHVRDANVSPNFARLVADLSQPESTNTTWAKVEKFSNGFKLGGNDSVSNESGQTYIYMAFAENPFVTSTDNGSIPACAR